VTEVVFSADMNSISTNNENRDTHLKSVDFFDVKQYENLTFEGIKFEKQGLRSPNFLSAQRRDYKLHGNLTIKGITHPVVLDGDFGGTATDQNGQKRAGFTVKGKIERKAFGLDWDGTNGTNTLILGNEVQIFGNIQLVKQEG
jgi:polyisoprenoid-binding protein YceI